MAYLDYYIKSKDINVFPCAYRGQDGTNPVIIDPEARLNTENNFTHISTDFFETYIKEYNTVKKTVSFVISGYHFTISNINNYLGSTGFVSLKNRYLIIKTNSDKALGDYKTRILVKVDDTIEGSETLLDRKETLLESAEYYFLGLLVRETDLTENERADGMYSIKLFDSNGQIDNTKFLPQIFSGTDRTAIAMKGCSATSEYSAAFGLNTIASKPNSFVIGKYNTSLADNDLFVVGSGENGQPFNSFIINTANITLNKPTLVNEVLETATNKQVTINGNLDAKAGIDITGANLDVGSTNFIVTQTGAITTKQGLDTSEAIKIATNKVILNKDGTATFVGLISADGGVTVATNKNLILLGQKSDKKSGETNINCALQIDKDGQILINKTLQSDSPTVPTSNYYSTEFIDTVCQAYDGKITATKKKFVLVNNGQGSLSLNGNAINITNLSTTGNPTFTSINTSKIQGTDDAKKVEIYTNISESSTVNINNYGTAGTTSTNGASVSIFGGLSTSKASYIGESLNINGQIKLNENSAGDISCTTANATTSLTTPLAFIDYLRYISMLELGVKDSDANSVTIRQAYQNATSSTGTGTLVVNGGIKTTAFNSYFGGTLTTANTTKALKFIATTTSSTAYSFANKESSPTFYVTGAGKVTASTYNATSDKRLKENIVDYTPEKSILDLKIKKFDFINGPKNQIGCLAQDLQKICPELVEKNADGYLSIQENKLVYLLLDEVKKLKIQISKLEEK